MILSLLDKLFGNEDAPKQGAPKNIKHDPNQIANLLTRYQQQDHLVTAILMQPGQRKLTRFSTGVLAVDLPKQTFTTDELVPMTQDLKLAEGTKLQFSLTHHGVRHQFEAAYVSTATAPDIGHHVFQFPKGIEQIQLRDAFRVKLSQAHPIKVTLTTADTGSYSGTLADLSATGMRVRLDGSDSAKPVRGQVYKTCHFVLGDGQKVECPARLMHWQFDPERKVTYLGIQFQDLDGNTQRTLNRYLTELQRKQRQLS